jgi:hypothetical protein
VSSSKLRIPVAIRFIELLLAPHSLADGHAIRKLEFRKKYGFTAVTLLREGRSYPSSIPPGSAGFSLELH